MTSNERRGGGREVEPPNFGRAYDQIKKDLEKGLKKSRDAGTPFAAESVMPREVFDTLNDDANLTAAGWDLLRKDYYDRKPKKTADVVPQPVAEKEIPAAQPEEVSEAAKTPGDKPKKKSLRAERREEERRAADLAAASQPAPERKEPTRKETAAEPSREKESAGPKPHEYVIKKTRDGFEMVKRGGEGSENRTFPTNVVLKENLVARLEKDPSFAETLVAKANDLRREWYPQRSRRALSVDLPQIDGIEWGENVEEQIAEMVKDPNGIDVTVTFNIDRRRRDTRHVAATEVFPGKVLGNVLAKMPRRSMNDEGAREDWKRWGINLFRNGIVDYIVGEELSHTYATPTESAPEEEMPSGHTDNAPANLPTADTAKTVSYGPAKREPRGKNAPFAQSPKTVTPLDATPNASSPETKLSRLLAASAGPSGPPESVDELDARWKQENPDDVDSNAIDGRLKRNEPLSPLDRAPSTPAKPAEPPPLPKKKPSEPPPLPKKPEATKPEPTPEEPVTEVEDTETKEVKPEPPKAPEKKPEKAPEAANAVEAPKPIETRNEAKERTAARSAVTVTLEKVANAIPELGEKLAAPGLREFMTGWYVDLFTRKSVTGAERAAFGLVYDAATNKVVVKMKTFRNTIDALKELHEETGA